MEHVEVIVVWACVSAAIGTVPFTVLLPRLLGRPDPRAAGTRVPSVSNTIMVAGRPIGIGSALLEGSKGLIAVVPMRVLGMPLWAQALCLFVTVVATRFSPFLGFRGGQARTPGMWGLAAAAPLTLVVLYVVWLIVMAVTGSSSKGVDVALLFLAPALGIATWSLVGFALGVPFSAFYLIGRARYPSEMQHYELLGKLSR